VIFWEPEEMNDAWGKMIRERLLKVALVYV